MAYTREQIQKAYKELPEEIQYLAMSNESMDIIKSASQNIGFNENEGDIADSEILYSLLGLQTLDDALNHIAQQTGKEVGKLSQLKSVVQHEILDKYTVDVATLVQKNKPGKTEPSQTSPVAPLPQTPPKPEQPLTIDVPSSSTTTLPAQPATTPSPPATAIPPTNAPEVSATKTRPSSDLGVPNYTYESGQDPYREPIDNQTEA